MSMSGKERLLLLAGIATIVAIASLAMRSAAGQVPTAMGKAPAGAVKTGPAPKTPWGEPDLQGIWSREVDIPLERPTKYADREFFTEAERAELDRLVADIVSRESDESRRARGTERDVNSEFAQAPYTVHLPVGRRTSLIVDPPNGRIPPLTPEAKKARDAFRQFQLALLQPTAACKDQHPGCAGGKYGPVSPRRDETPPVYVGVGPGGINRANGPEDRNLGERCLNAAVPDFGNVVGGGFRRIVQAPGEISMFYDGGQSWPRNIPITTAAHLPSTIRQWWGDSRGRWEGTTLVVDVTNFSPKSDFQGARENLHLVERWTRLDADTIEYAVTIDDPTRWTRSWTVEQELKKQSDAANRIYHEPRCHEGNYGLAALLRGARAVEQAFAEGRGPNPATMCIVIACGGFVRGGFADEGPDADPFQSPPPMP